MSFSWSGDVQPFCEAMLAAFVSATAVRAFMNAATDWYDQRKKRPDGDAS